MFHSPEESSHTKWKLSETLGESVLLLLLGLVMDLLFTFMLFCVALLQAEKDPTTSFSRQHSSCNTTPPCSLWPQVQLLTFIQMRRHQHITVNNSSLPLIWHPHILSPFPCLHPVSVWPFTRLYELDCLILSCVLQILRQSWDSEFVLFFKSLCCNENWHKINANSQVT